MSNFQTHFDQAEYNFHQAISLSENGNYDWAVTLIFYTALHFVEGGFVLHDNKNSARNYAENNSHKATIDKIAIVYDMNCKKIYERLHDLSETSRYLHDLSGEMTAFNYFKLKDIKELLIDLESLLEMIRRNTIFTKKQPEINRLQNTVIEINDYLNQKN